MRRWLGCRVVFEAGMNWHWLFEILQRELSSERIVLANPFKTRIIAEAQIKTDKVDVCALPWPSLPLQRQSARQAGFGGIGSQQCLV